MELEESVRQESESMYREMSVDLFRVIDGLGALPQLFPTSSQTGDGIDDLYAHIQQMFQGGEDTMSEDPDKR